MSRFLASVNIFAETTQVKNVVTALSNLNNVEEVYEVVGEYDIVTVVCTSTLEECRDLLQKQIMKIKGVKSTIVTVVLAPIKGHRCLKKTVVASTTWLETGATVNTNVPWRFGINDRCSSSAISHHYTWSNYTPSKANSTIHNRSL